MSSVWEKCASITELKDQFQNYPLYASARTKLILNSIMMLSHKRLKRERADDTGNKLITYVQGIGKSTLMKGAAIATAVLCPNVLVIFKNYQEQVVERLTHTIIEMAKLKSEKVRQDKRIEHMGDDMDEVLAYLAGEPDLQVAFFGDEIQTLFVPKKQHGDVEVDLIGQMIKIGKGYTSFGVISGSSHNTEYMAFNAHDVMNYEAYSSLNSTVYSALRLSRVGGCSSQVVSWNNIH